MERSQVSGFCMRALNGVVYGGMTCIFALGGAIVGSVTGALKGQTTETGLLRGAGIGSVAGAVVSVELLESLIQGDILSKIALLTSLVNGKIFREWVSPAMLKAYQWQISNNNANERVEYVDIFSTNCNDDGMCVEDIKKLPEFELQPPTIVDDNGAVTSCSICLQDFSDGERGRRLSICKHIFHKRCVDMWLLKHGTCPICRHVVVNN